MKQFLPVLFGLFFIAQAAMAQTFAIKGKLTDKKSGEALPGATVQVQGNGANTGGITEVNGTFKVGNLTPGTYTVTASYIGYVNLVQTAVVKDRDVTLTFQLAEDNATLNEVEIVADVAVERETPVAFSAIKESTIRESLAGRDLPMILNETPGVYANGGGGGAGDSEISIRGFSQNNVAVMVNGVPVNDMENGQVYWSNWDLSDVTKSMQVQRGLSASKLATPSVGGTMNILTRGFEKKESFIARQEMGSNNYLKTSLMYSSGNIGKDWAFTIYGSRRKGDGWVEGTFDDAYTYFGNISKRIGNHTLSLTGLGSPQVHGQRSFAGSDYRIRVYDADKTKEMGALKPGEEQLTTYGFDYNGNYAAYDRYTISGTDTIHNRKTLNSQQNFYHKPQINLNHFWTISEKLFVSNVLYASIGNGGGSFLAGASVPTANSRTNYQKIYDDNYRNKVSSVVDRASVNNHRWYGFISGLDYKVTESTTLSLGVDGRSYKGEHYVEVLDLFGGEYTKITATGSALGANANQDRNARLEVGDKVGNTYDGMVRYAGGFAMAEYKSNVISAFISGTVSQTFYNRINYSQAKLFNINGTDYPVRFVNEIQGSALPLATEVNGVYYTQAPYIYMGKDTIKLNPDAPVTYKNIQYQQAVNGKNQESDGVNLLGYSIKGGVNYNLNEFNNIFFNAGYISRPPFIDFIFSRTSGQKIQNVNNESVTSFEIGYGINRGSFKANLNSYYTLWNDKATSVTRDSDLTPQGTVTYNVSGMNARHIGMELELAQQISRKLDLNAAISLGDWIWTSTGVARGFDDNGTELPEVVLNAEGVHVGGAAQNQFMIGLRYEPFKSFYIRSTYLMFSKNYASFNPDDLPAVGTPQDSYRLPTSYNVDLHSGYSFKFYKDLKLSLNGSVLNLLDEFYIMRVDQSSKPSDPTSIEVFFNRGRTFILGASIMF